MLFYWFFVNILGFPSFSPSYTLSSLFQIILSIKVVLPIETGNIPFEKKNLKIITALFVHDQRKKEKYLLASDLNNHKLCIVSILHRKGAL